MDKIKVHKDKLVISCRIRPKSGTDAYIPHHKQTLHLTTFLTAKYLDLTYIPCFLFTINYPPFRPQSPYYPHSHLWSINRGRIILPHHAIPIRTLRRKQRRHPIQPNQNQFRFRFPIPSSLPNPLPLQRRMDACQRPTKLPRIPTRRSPARSRRGNGLQIPSSSCYDGYCTRTPGIHEANRRGGIRILRNLLCLLLGRWVVVG